MILRSVQTVCNMEMEDVFFSILLCTWFVYMANMYMLYSSVCFVQVLVLCSVVNTPGRHPACQSGTGDACI